MIKITNGANTIEVTNGAYETIYSRQGYKPVASMPIVQDDGNVTAAVKTEDEQFFDKMVSTPLGQWSKEQAKRFAEICDIPLDGVGGFEEVKERIKAWMDENLADE